MKVLDRIRDEMDALPKEKQLYEMGNIYYSNIPKIVDILLADRAAVKLIINCAKGTKYEGIIDKIAGRNAMCLNKAAENSESKAVKSIKTEILEILMDGYVRTLFRLVISDKNRETIIQCMEMVGKIYETGIIALMQEKTEK